MTGATMIKRGLIRSPGASSPYRQPPELFAEIQQTEKKFADGVLLSKRLGKIITTTDIKTLLAGKSAAGKTGAQIDNIDDL
jgi:hypothetical protein